MNKKRTKIWLIIFVLVLVILPNFCYAIDTGLSSLDDYAKSMGESQRLKEMTGPIITVLQTIGSITSVVVLIVIGIKYMIGSIEERAEYKKTFMPYIIGCAIVFAFSNLIGIIYNITINMLK